MSTYRKVEKSSFVKTHLKASPEYTGMEKDFSKPSKAGCETQESRLEMPLPVALKRRNEESVAKWVGEHMGCDPCGSSRQFPLLLTIICVHECETHSCPCTPIGHLL